MQNFTSAKFFFLLSFVILSLTVSHITAQTDTAKKDLSYYFNDKITESNLLIKVCPTSLIKGELPFFLEKSFGDVFSLCVGAGYQFPYYLDATLFHDLENDIPIKTPVSGYGLYLNPRFYINGGAPEGGFTGAQFRQRIYFSGDEKIIESSYTWFSGIQYGIFRNKRLMLEYSLGLGWAVRKRTKPPGKEDVANSGSSIINFTLSYKI